MTEKFEKALLGEGMAACDRCGYTGPVAEFYYLPLNQIGETLDLCRKCFLDPDGWGEKY
jgi:hypothetical protein